MNYEIKNIIESISDADYRGAVLDDGNKRDVSRLESVSLAQCVEWYSREGHNIDF